MRVNKASLSTQGSHLNIAVPFAKVDKENRTVSGFATLDNIDRQGDVVLASASKEAFASFRGNIREMPQSIAAGRVVAFREDQGFDPETQKFYRAIYVTAYVSKGAQDTWEKVLDGTLSGFSIGGNINESEPFYDPEFDKSVRIIKNYSLVELSLVDSPANQLANVFSISKSDTGELSMSGPATLVKTSNVFWCDQDHVAKVSDGDDLSCTCGTQMQNIGWIESSEENKSDSVAAVVNKFLAPGAPDNKSEHNISEGGIEMADTIEKTDSVEAPAEETTEVVDEVTPAIEKADEVSEVEAEGTELSKEFDGLRKFFSEEITKVAGSATEAVAEVTKNVEAVASKAEGFDEKLAEVTKSFEAAISEVSAKVEELAKTFAADDSAAAVKKSEDLGGSEAPAVVKSESSIWRGSFLSVSDL